VLDERLLDSKLTPPLLRRGLVSRVGLIETARSSDCRVVGVTAPAGYGKSTLLAEWARREDRRVAWVSLDRFDDDPAALLALLATAYARMFPDDSELLADVGGLGVSVLGRAAPRLASAFRASRVPFVIMLDDLHELPSAACHDVLSVVISGVPRGSQLIAASRSEQPHIPRFRASGDALDFGMSDLALDSAGAEQIFAGAHVALTKEQATAVTERTEGWPVGLYLAALVAGDDSGMAATISGDDRYVSDYLYRESLSQLPESDQRFLRRTAVLDQLCAPLCETVLGESGAQRQLRKFEASNSFLIPLDRQREWYRYHGLFREFLLGELRTVEPDVIAELHLRAADWYESNGSLVPALEHVSQTTERARGAQLVAQLALPAYQAGQIATVERWLSMVGDPAIEAYPPLAVLAGWISLLTGQTAAAERWAAMLDTLSFELVPLDGSASFESSRAMFRAAFCSAGPEHMLSDASFAVAQEPPESPWLNTAVCLLAEAHLLTGDVDQAAALFAEASTLATTMSNADILVMSGAELAVLEMDRGRWTEAAERVNLALATIEAHRMEDHALSVLAFAVAARLALHHGDLKQANARLTQAMRARPSCNSAMPYLGVRSRVQLAKVHWAIADHTAAHHLLREIDDILQRRPALGALVATVSELRRTATSSPRDGAAAAVPLTPAELRLLPYLQTHFTTREIAERLFVSRSTVNTQIGSIYRKLGVSSRTDAVQHATTVGLLGG
jgi:LuxR family maltose regulon positive regulatory protein